jgi:hypothetical protein
MIIEALCEIEKPPPASVEGKVVAVVHSSAALMMALQNLATSLAWTSKVEDHGILIHFAIGHQSTSGMSQRELQVS